MHTAACGNLRQKDGLMSAEIHVLLVEDQPSLRTTLERALRLQGYVVISAESGPQAQAIFATRHVGLLLTDVALSGEFNGFRLAEWVRGYRPALPIILISGLALYDPPAWLTTDPHVRMLPKPFTLATLMGALAELSVAA